MIYFQDAEAALNVPNLRIDDERATKLLEASQGLIDGSGDLPISGRAPVNSYARLDEALPVNRPTAGQEAQETPAVDFENIGTLLARRHMDLSGDQPKVKDKSKELLSKLAKSFMNVMGYYKKNNPIPQNQNLSTGGAAKTLDRMLDIAKGFCAECLFFSTKDDGSNPWLEKLGLNA